MTECPFCKGPVDEQRIEHVHRWEEQLYILRNVQVEVCSQCGEVFFAPQVLKAMDDVVKRKKDPDDHSSLPVFSL